MHDKELENCRLVSMMGVKPNIVLETMVSHNILPQNVVLCSDNDTAGNDFAHRLQEQYPEMKRIITPDTYKDWNDMLHGIPKEEQKTEQKSEIKEADSMANLQYFGNEMWNRATDNRDKSLVSMPITDFQRVHEQLEHSGINYYAYASNGTVRMAVNDKDIDWLRQLIGEMSVSKSNRAYSPPEKNIIGNAEYRYIPQKEYFSADRDMILKMAEIMNQRGIHFSGRIYPTGKGTLTVSHDDIFEVRSIQNEIAAMRKQFAPNEKAVEVGNRGYDASLDTYHYVSKLNPDQFREIKPYLETGIAYHAIANYGRVAFAVEKENAPAFHRALENAEREVGMLHTADELGLSAEQMAELKPVIHRLAVEDVRIQLADFFDRKYDEAQFGEMLSLVNAYLAQSPAERYGENSKLSEMLEAKSNFDRSIELSIIFSLHDFSDEQRAAITAMYVGGVTIGQIDCIDETFTVEDIQAYDEILHTALQESDITDFLNAHRQVVADKENAPTEEEKVLFSQANLAMFIAEGTLSSDEWEDMAYPLFENGYVENHKPSDKAGFGYHMSEPAFYDLAQRYHDGEDIRKELAIGLMEHSKTDDIEFVFEDGKISDRTYYYAENLRQTLHAEFGEDSVKLSFKGMERGVTYAEIGQAFLDRTLDEYNDLAYWRVLDFIKDDIPDISDETVELLIKAFDGAALEGWDKGNNQPKINRIKKALHDILGDEEQTEKAFACIAKHKYNVTFEAKELEKQPDSLAFHFGSGENDEWISESDLAHNFAIEHPDCSFALGKAIFEYLDEKQHSEREVKELHAGYYKKTDFTIHAVINGESFNYEGRFDIGDGKGTGGGSLIDHIRDHNQGLLDSTQYPYNQPEYKEKAKHTLDVVIPFLEAHSALTAEEQKILDDFKAQHPIRTIDDVDIGEPDTFKLYQLKEGEEYHGVRFETLERVKLHGVQLNTDDYNLVYEGNLSDYSGDSIEAKLEALYEEFNINRPIDFTGHSMSVSDVVVVNDDAYYCNDIGFVEFPEFLKEKEMESPVVSAFRAKTEKQFEAVDGNTPTMIENQVKDFVSAVFEENGVDAEIIGAAVTGSRSRGLENADSDIDVVIEVNSDLKEDALFNLIHETEFSVGGVTVDINPIRADETGTLETYLPAAEQYLAEKVESKAKSPKVADLEVGDVILYENKRREVEKISSDSIMLKDLDAPDFGGILLGTSDVLAYDGWQEDMERKGFEILSKAHTPEVKKVHQVVTNAGFDGGIDDKLEYATAEEAVQAGKDYLADGYLGFAVINHDTKEIERVEGDFPVEKAFSEEVLRINGIVPDKGTVTMRKVGDFYEMYGKNAEIGAEVLDLHISQRNGSPMAGFPTFMKDKNSEKLKNAGYTVLIEEAFELNPPKKERVSSLDDVLSAFLDSRDDVVESENGTWKVSMEVTKNGYTDPVVYHNGNAECSFHLAEDTFQIDPLTELSSVPAMVARSLREQAPDKKVQLMDYEPNFDTPLDKAKYLINSFCEAEYESEADFSDLHNIGIAYTTLTDDEVPVQVTADLADYKLIYEFGGEVYNTEQFDSLEDMIENGLTGLDFSELVTVPDEVIESYAEKDAVEESDIDKPLFSDASVIEEIQKNEHSDVPLSEMPDIQGEQLSLFDFDEPIPFSKPEKKSEFAKGPVVDGVQVYEALSADIDRGTGFENGKIRVQDFYEENQPNTQQLAEFLKKEYGIGGHSGEGAISFVDYDSKGITFTFENDEKFRHGWTNAATMVETKIRDDSYLTAEEQAKRQALHEEKSAEQTPQKVEIGDQFRNKMTGEVSEVVSLTGALPWYTDQCAVSTEKGGFVVTENISYDKLLNSDLYEYIGKAELEKEQSAPVKAASANEADKTDIPTVKSLAQLKKVLKPGMVFEITDHLRPECIGERRIVTGVSTVDFTSRKLDENGEPTGKDLHMEFDRAKNWNFDGSEMTSRLDNGDMLMSFHFIDSLERTKELEYETVTPEISDTDEVIAEEISAPEPTPDKGSNFTITDDALGEGGAKTKFRANIEAIKALKKIESDNLALAADMFKPRHARPEEQELLSKYVGWGAVSKAFDRTDEKWSAESAELAELLTPEEYRQARASVNDAFFTAPVVIDAIYEALGNFGFNGGTVLEPSMGVGNFFGRMPEEMQKNSQLYGVELDSLTGRIAQALYPDADIAIKGFEKNTFQNGCFDVAVGNVPFGELGFTDEKHRTTKLHDYFFAETLDKLKDGGIMAFVTSAGTLDKRDEATRQMLAEKADFIGAIRLPGGKNGAFKDNAGTEVTTDIIFLQKHEEKSVPTMTDMPDWVHIGETADGLPINKYFEQHPDMVLGTVVEGNKLYGSGTMVVADEKFDLKTALHEAVGKLSAEINPERSRDVYAKTADGVQVEIPSNLRNYSFFMSDDQVFFKKNNTAYEFRFDKKTAQHSRFKAFIELRDLTRELLEAQEHDKPDDVIKDLQAKLNVAYDDFYAKYGLIHSQTNKRYFSEDVSYNLVAGLEKSYDKTNLKEKSDIFFKRTIVPPKAVESVDTALEALTLSIAERAKIDFLYMGKLTGMSEDELKKELSGEIFKIPHSYDLYQTASEYLSGDIRAKLREAEEVAEYDADFNVNVSALKAVMPEPLKAGDIDIKLGATWLDPKYYEQFIYELLQTPAYQRSDSPSARWNKNSIIGVEYSEHTNSFHVSCKSADKSVLATQKFGSHKMNAYDIFEHILNLQEPKVYKSVEYIDDFGEAKEKRVVDIDATRVVQRKADDMRKAFKNWIFRDPVRRDEIVTRYNELFNSIRPREFDGSSLSFPMMTSDIKLHDHQKNAIAHAMFGGNTLFAHCVGAGKTFEMIATAMESKRLGLCTKSMFAVPNHLTEQIGSDFQQLYPSANILVATKKDFKKENRQQLFAKIATGNYDAVIIGHSQLGMIPVSKERQVMTIQAQIDDILLGIAELKEKEGSKFQIKAMERSRKSLQKQLDKLEKANQDDTLTFEQLGIDRLFVDECHEYKNLFVNTKLSNVAGISSSASQKALDLFLKCRYLDEKTGGKGVVFATGTPIATPFPL